MGIRQRLFFLLGYLVGALFQFVWEVAWDKRGEISRTGEDIGMGGGKQGNRNSRIDRRSFPSLSKFSPCSRRARVHVCAVLPDSPVPGWHVQ